VVLTGWSHVFAFNGLYFKRKKRVYLSMGTAVVLEFFSFDFTATAPASIKKPVIVMEDDKVDDEEKTEKHQWRRVHSSSERFPYNLWNHFSQVCLSHPFFCLVHHRILFSYFLLFRVPSHGSSSLFP